MRTYDSSIHSNSRRRRIAPALMAALVVVLLFGVGLWGGVRVLATGDGTVSGTATAIIGISRACTLSGELTGGSVINDVAGFDVATVTDSLKGGGQCSGLPPFSMTGSITGTMLETTNSNPGIMDFSIGSPGSASFEVFLSIASDTFGPNVHNLTGEPLMMTCPSITSGKLFPCTSVSAIPLYNSAEDTVVGTLTTVTLNFEGLSVGGLTELPEVEDTSLQSSDSSGTSAAVVAGIAAGATAGVVVLGGGAWYTRKVWLRRSR